jgi:ankyrin repeat protein
MAMTPKLAAVIEKYHSHPEFLGIDISDPNQPGAVDDRMLHIAARMGAVEDIEILVAAGAEVNAAGDLGNTPLHQAVMRGQVSSVQKLLELGADRNQRNEFGQTALEVAELSARDDIAEMLRDYCDSF